MSNDPNQETNLDYEAEGAGVAEVHGAVEREKDVPMTRPGHEPVELRHFILMIFVFIFAGGYFFQYSNGFGSSIYAFPYYDHQGPDPRPAVEGAAVEEEQGPWIDRWVKDGKKVYGNCLSCHGADGNGQPGLFPPLNGSEWVHGGNERMAAIVLKGLQGPFTVAGKQYNNVMAPWEALGPEDLAQVLTYVRTEFGNFEDPQAAVVTEEMMKAAMEKFSGRSQPWTEAELKEIPADAMLPGAKVDLETGQPADGEGGGETAPPDKP